FAGLLPPSKAAALHPERTFFGGPASSFAKPWRTRRPTKKRAEGSYCLKRSEVRSKRRRSVAEWRSEAKATRRPCSAGLALPAKRPARRRGRRGRFGPASCRPLNDICGEE